MRKGKTKKNFKLLGKLYFASHKIIRWCGGGERAVAENRVKRSLLKRALLNTVKSFKTSEGGMTMDMRFSIEV